MIFESKIAGIPCKIKVLHHIPYRPSKVYGNGDADPPEYEDLEYMVLDRKEYPAPWLIRKLKPEDNDRFLEEYHLQIDGERYGYL